jgi:phosphoglucosamine mutase
MADVAATKKTARKQPGTREKTNGKGAKPAARAERQLFGTDGIRGTANVHPMTPELALALGKAVAFVAGRNKAHTPRILIGKDTRLSGYMIEQAIAAGICSIM